MSPPSRRELRLEDLSLLAETLRAPEEPLRICQTLESIGGEVIGHRLFTVIRFDGGLSEVQRIHSSLPAVYPVGGRKQKKATAWADQVLGEIKVVSRQRRREHPIRLRRSRKNSGAWSWMSPQRSHRVRRPSSVR